MNRLNKARCYLCGAVDRVADRGHGWREELTETLEALGVDVFNPLKKPTLLGAEDNETAEHKKKLKEQKRYDELTEIMKTIRGVDLRMVDVSDFLIANINLEHYAVGTYEEIFLANRQKKPIIIHMEQGKEHTPDWLFGAVPHHMIFSKWVDIKDYLCYIDGAESIDTYKRWYFFNIGE
jgi:nucleoside 2-deoxyribosyltransferase